MVGDNSLLELALTLFTVLRLIISLNHFLIAIIMFTILPIATQIPFFNQFLVAFIT